MRVRLGLVGLALISVAAAGCGSAGPAPGRDASDAPQQQPDAGDDASDASDVPEAMESDASDAAEAGPEVAVDPCSLCSPYAICNVRRPADGGTDAGSSDDGVDAAPDGDVAEAGASDAAAPEGGASDATGSDASSSDEAGTDAASDDGGASDEASPPDAGAPPPACMCRPGYAGDGMTCVEVAAGLSGLRWNLPCGAHDMDTCPTVADMKTAMISGQAGKTYAVTLRFRGVIEQKTYAGGTGSGYWLAGATAPIDGFNVYSLTVSSPAQVYYLNAGTTGMHRVFTIDYTETVDMDANAMLTLAADPVDGAEIVNTDGMGHSLPVPGIQPYPGVFDGQFIQVDVLSVVAK
jgi:hypothetical protein